VVAGGHGVYLGDASFARGRVSRHTSSWSAPGSSRERAVSATCTTSIHIGKVTDAQTSPPRPQSRSVQAPLVCMLPPRTLGQQHAGEPNDPRREKTPAAIQFDHQEPGNNRRQHDRDHRARRHQSAPPSKATSTTHAAAPDGLGPRAFTAPTPGMRSRSARSSRSTAALGSGRPTV